MKAYKAFLGAAVGAGALSLLVGCEDSITAPIKGVADQLTIIVSPASAEIAMGDIVQFTATLEGKLLQGSQVRWITSDPQKARVVGDGLVLGVEPGAVAIIAEHAAGTGRAQVRVRYAPDSGYGDGDDKGEKEQPAR
jgi:Bacterial Ig-like domain (group 2)